MPDKLWRFKPGNKEREQQRLAAYYQAHKLEIDAKRRARYANNKEAELARNKVWTLRNIDHHRKLNRQWAKLNPLDARALVARRRARLKAADGYFTAKDVHELFAKQQALCAACKSDISQRFEVDHILALMRGGSNWPSNLQLLCMPCNRSKSDKLWDQWIAECRHAVSEG